MARLLLELEFFDATVEDEVGLEVVTVGCWTRRDRAANVGMPTESALEWEGAGRGRAPSCSSRAAHSSGSGAPNAWMNALVFGPRPSARAAVSA